MAEWHYKSNKVPIDQGYHVTLPRKKATPDNYTAFLELPGQNERIYIWLHQIEASFQVSGSFAQSARGRQWFPRNFVQPSFKFTGQFANQHEYGNFSEFVRRSQGRSLGWRRNEAAAHTTRLVIRSREGMTYPRDGSVRHSRAPYELFGHILSIERKYTRFVNAPEFSFDFLISFANTGLFQQSKEDQQDYVKRRLAKWMEIFAQDPRETFVIDPDDSYDRAINASPGGDINQ